MIRPFLFNTLLAIATSLPSFSQESPPLLFVPGQEKMSDRIQGPWILQSWTVDGKKELMHRSRISLVFQKKKKFHGNAGINSFSGTFRSVGSSLVFKLIGITEMGGPPAAMKREATFIQLLGKMATAQLKGNILTLSSRSGKYQLEFAIPKPPQNEPLIGTTWSLQLFSETDGATESATSLVANTSLTLGIDEQGKINGSGGVNRYFGTARIGKDGRIEINALGSTKKAGPPAAMKQEARFFLALEGAKSYAIDGKRLTLSNAGKTQRLIFEAR